MFEIFPRGRQWAVYPSQSVLNTMVDADWATKYRPICIQESFGFCNRKVNLLMPDVIFLWDCSVYFQILDVLASYHYPSDMSSNVILKSVVLVHFVHFRSWARFFFTNISIPSHLNAGKRNPMTTTRLWHLGTWLVTGHPRIRQKYWSIKHP